MATKRQTAQLTAQALRRGCGLALVYAVLIFVLPPSQATINAYGLSPLEYRAILFIIGLPSIVAWLAAFVGYAKLREYVSLVRKTPEGPYLDRLATGCAWLAWSLPAATILSLLISTIGDQQAGFYSASIIINNYLGLLLPLVAFSIIGAASRGLVAQAKLRLSLTSIRLIMTLFLAAGILYCYMTFRRFDLSSLSSTQNPYFLPIWLMVISVIIPYLYMWFIGLLAAYEITLFSQHTEGVLYRQALRLLVVGLAVIIASSIALQYMTGIQPRVGRLMFGYHLVLASVFRLVGGSGFILLAIGATKLKKIEEI